MQADAVGEKHCHASLKRVEKLRVCDVSPEVFCAQLGRLLHTFLCDKRLVHVEAGGVRIHVKL